jgi:hypothetical protein
VVACSLPPDQQAHTAASNSVGGIIGEHKGDVLSREGGIEMRRRLGAVILGMATVAAAVFGYLQWRESIHTAEESAHYYATQLAYSEQQNRVSNLIATTVMGEVPGPAATALAPRVADLQLTQVALSMEQAQALSVSPQGSPEWVEQSNNVPSVGSQLSRNLSSGEFLFLSAGRFQVDGVFCGDDSSQLCVLIFEATRAQRVTITRLIAGNNYLAITGVYGYDDILRIHQPFFWRWPNCQTQNGCAKATVFYLRDGNMVSDPSVIRRP